MNHSVNIYKIKLSDIKSTPEVFKAIDCDTDVDILEHIRTYKPDSTPDSNQSIVDYSKIYYISQTEFNKLNIIPRSQINVNDLIQINKYIKDNCTKVRVVMFELTDKGDKHMEDIILVNNQTIMNFAIHIREMLYPYQNIGITPNVFNMWELLDILKTEFYFHHDINNRSSYYITKSNNTKYKQQAFTQETFIHILDSITNSYEKCSDTPLDINLDNGFYQKIIINDERAKVCIIGDIHSSLHSFIDILNNIKKEYFKDDDTFKLKEDRYIIFLGDIVDRGPYSIELLVIIFYLKIINFNNVYIINGNHEHEMLSTEYGLAYEMYLEYDRQFFYTQLNNIWKYQPVCIILQMYKKDTFHLCHGSFDKNYKQYKDEFKKFITNTNNHNEYYVIDPTSKYYILWSDMNLTLDVIKDSVKEGRGPDLSLGFIKEYLKDCGIRSIISGHQDVVNLSLFTDKEYLNNTTYAVNGYKLYSDYGYVYRSAKSDNYECFDLPKFSALVTSTASYSKYKKSYLTKNCYIELYLE